MKKYKFRLITLVAAFLLFLGAAIGGGVSLIKANAADYSPSGIFSVGSNGGAVGASEEADGASYIQLAFSDNDDAVHFRRDLALKWYESKGEVRYFNVEFSFPEIKFDTFTVSFESAQESVSKDGTTKNAIVFKKDGDKITAACKYAEEELGAGVEVDISAGVKLSFANDVNGDFDVLVGETKIGQVKNIGGYFMEYFSSASSTPRIPMTFQAELTEGETEQLVIVKSLNGQSFLLSEGKVVDNAAPALVVNEKLNSFALGYKFALTYEVVDVCNESVSVTREYAMYEAPAEGEEEKELTYESLSTSTYFLPKSEGSKKELVSVRFKLDDGRALSGEEDEENAYLSWYVQGVETKNDVDFIPVVRDTVGPAFACIKNDDSTKQSTLDEMNQAYLDYAESVKEASEGLNAGTGANFYLPSLRGLIADDNTDYSNMKFTVYYKTQFSSNSNSESSLSYNALKFAIKDEAEYSFRVTATDKLGNQMQVYDDGRLVTVTSSNVWDLDCIPQFTFSAKSKGASIEKSGEQSLGYRDSTYSVSSFDIVAVEGYEVEYSLYYFNQDKYSEKNNGSMPTYSEMVKSAETYADYLDEIRAYDNTVEKDDAAWDDTDNDYEWNASARTFRPQKSGFYFVKASVTDKVYWNEETKVAYKVIEVRNPIDSYAGETYWLQNNIVAVVLFGISALLLVAIIVLFIVKPSDKKVEEVDLGKLKGKKNKKD